MGGMIKSAAINEVLFAADSDTYNKNTSNRNDKESNRNNNVSNSTKTTLQSAT